jgi:hypothetical protein
MSSNVVYIEHSDPDPILPALQHYLAVEREKAALLKTEDAISREDPRPQSPRELRAWERRYGLASRRVWDEVHRAEKRLKNTTPTTVAGCIAVVEAIAAEDEDGLTGWWHAAALKNVAEALRWLRA